MKWLWLWHGHADAHGTHFEKVAAEAMTSAVSFSHFHMEKNALLPRKPLCSPHVLCQIPLLVKMESKRINFYGVTCNSTALPSSLKSIGLKYYLLYPYDGLCKVGLATRDLVVSTGPVKIKFCEGSLPLLTS